MGNELSPRAETIAELTPAWKILDELPEACKACIQILPKVDELSFWVSQERITAAGAARLILEKAGCENPTNA